MEVGGDWRFEGDPRRHHPLPCNRSAYLRVHQPPRPHPVPRLGHWCAVPVVTPLISCPTRMRRRMRRRDALSRPTLHSSRPRDPTVSGRPRDPTVSLFAPPRWRFTRAPAAVFAGRRRRRRCSRRRRRTRRRCARCRCARTGRSSILPTRRRRGRRTRRRHRAHSHSRFTRRRRRPRRRRRTRRRRTSRTHPSRRASSTWRRR